MYDGRHKDKYRAEKGSVLVLAKEINGEMVKVTRDEVAGYVNDPVFSQMLQYWNYSKLWGMPNGHGWANESIDILEGITAIEMETRAIEAEAMEKHDSRGSQDPLRSRRRQV